MDIFCITTIEDDFFGVKKAKNDKICKLSQNVNFTNQGYRASSNPRAQARAWVGLLRTRPGFRAARW